MFAEIIYTLVAPAVLLFAQAAEIPVAPLAINFNPVGLVSSRLLAQNFSNTPRLAQVPPGQPAPAGAQAELVAFLIQRKTCADVGYHLTYRIIVRNQGLIPAINIVVQNQYPEGTTWSAAPFDTADRAPDEHDPAQRLLIWREGFLAPGDFVSYTFTVRVDARPLPTYTDTLTVTYDSEAGAGGQVSTDNIIRAGCQLPPVISTSPLTPAALEKQRVNIFCDMTQPGCTPILPLLGVNFERAKNPAQQVRVCPPGAPVDPRDPLRCIPNRPTLGARFREAIADIIPGDCRVLPDSVITSPDYQDALNRRAKASAVYLEPLYQADEDFKTLLLENALLGIDHTTKAYARLFPLRDPGAIASALQQLEREYGGMQQQRKEKFSEDFIREIVEKAIDSIRRACGGDQTNNLGVLNLRRDLPLAKQAYDQNLDQRSQAYRNMLQVFLPQAPAANRQAFDELFARTFTAHQKQDEASDKQIRLQQWDQALNSPKGAATACEAENVFAAPVESRATWCESNNYAQIIVQGAPQPEKAKQGLVAPPDLRNVPPLAGAIEPPSSPGASCRGRSGDPWWTADCSCQCGGIVPNIAEGTILPCGGPGGPPITRHDIFVTSREECLADQGGARNPQDPPLPGPGHQDPFF